MAAPLGKRTVMPSATRPWSLRTPSREPEIRRETARERREREICLHCEQPDCPSEQCPISDRSVNNTGRPPGKPKRIPPREFIEGAWGPMTNREWAERLHASPTTIRQWRREYAEQIKAARDVAASRTAKTNGGLSMGIDHYNRSPAKSQRRV